MLDVDLVVVEYERTRPVALIDYKRMRPRPLSDPSLTTLARLGDMAGLPAFVVFYAPAVWRFQPVALNKVSRRTMPGIDGSLRELEYVEWLYSLRGREMPGEVARRLLEVGELIA
jgi:hypothetical protein